MVACKAQQHLMPITQATAWRDCPDFLQRKQAVKPRDYRRGRGIAARTPARPVRIFDKPGQQGRFRNAFFCGF
jgi:hypothetical protein